LFSCSNTSNEESKEQTEISTHKEHHHDEESEAIELNNGKKWKVDANMITSIRNMENDIISFSNDEQKDYKSLAQKLQRNIDLLTSSCTMTGKAHDELHKWLLPYIDLVYELSKTTNETQALKQFENIQTSISTFNQYFQ
ncbi:MAG: hypothetical protein KJ941_05040, partial [Bacteroidetes bacterium]|nr:hypothetical protein [Bacteroidota bacterium]